MRNTLAPQNSTQQENVAVILARDGATAGIVYTAFGGTVSGKRILVLQKKETAASVDTYTYATADADADFDTFWATRAAATYSDSSDLRGLVLPPEGVSNLSLGAGVGGIVTTSATGATFVTLPDQAGRVVMIINNATGAVDIEVAFGSDTTGFKLEAGDSTTQTVAANANEVKIRRFDGSDVQVNVTVVTYNLTA